MSIYLTLPPKGQLLYKVITVENFIRSILGEYLYFNRVDSYKDFPKADLHDTEQLILDRPGNASSYFEKAPSFTVEMSYDTFRRRAYACSFSLENSDYIWRHYGVVDSKKKGHKGKICLVFNFDKLREILNENLSSEKIFLQYKHQQIPQIFDLNYGLIHYIDRNKLRINTEFLPNPIEYAYLKDKKYRQEQELRITLSTCLSGKFPLPDKDVLENFPQHLRMKFDFNKAIEEQVITKILTRNGEIICSNLSDIFQLNF